MTFPFQRNPEYSMFSRSVATLHSCAVNGGAVNSIKLQYNIADGGPL